MCCGVVVCAWGNHAPPDSLQLDEETQEYRHVDPRTASVVVWVDPMVEPKETK